MRRALILATLALLLMAVAGITVAQEEGFGPEGRFQTGPMAREATILEPTEVVAEGSVEGNEAARGDVIENSEEAEADNSEGAEYEPTKPESKRENRIKPKGVGRPEHVGKVAGRDKPLRTDKPVSNGRSEEPGKPVGVGKGEKARRPIGATKAKGVGEQSPRGGQQKITLCHKGKNTITVGAPAKDAHLRHGDSLGECGL